ncbi:unnamed protein product [Lathyrus sativus]|nr:unnamed protein product [Lathyrus sativus]
MYNHMYARKRGLKPHFEEGVKMFITWAFNQECGQREGGVRCMCLKCGCRHIISNLEEVETHLKRKEFKENYWVCTSNGEEMSMNMPETRNLQQGSSSRSQMEYEEQFNLHDDMIGDALGVNMAYNEQQDSDGEELPNEKAQNFYQLLKEINTPLFEGSSNSKLSMCVRLFVAKSNWNAPLPQSSQRLSKLCPSLVRGLSRLCLSL